MIGMPRITLIRPALRPDRTRMPDTRIRAHSNPSTVDSSREPMVTTTVSQTPCNRIGRNSAVSRRKFCIGLKRDEVRLGRSCGRLGAPLPLAGEVDALVERGGWGLSPQDDSRRDAHPSPPPQAGEGAQFLRGCHLA